MHTSRKVAKANFPLLVDVSISIAFSCLLLLVEMVHYLVKFSQQWYIFICDFLGAIKVCQVQLYTLYFYLQTMVWEASVLYLNETAMHLTFNCKQHTYPIVVLDTFGRPQQVSCEALATIIDEVKSLCQSKHMPLHHMYSYFSCWYFLGGCGLIVGLLNFVVLQVVAASLIIDFSSHFLASSLMDALGVVYPQY